VSSKDILHAADLTVREADVLIGGPPCQPFSKSGYWATGDALRLNDPRAGTLKHYLRVLGDTLPRAFLLENVAGLTFVGKREGLDFIKRGIAAINTRAGTNYSLSVESINAADFGVPQNRERVFIIGSRDGKKFSFPSATHGRQVEISSQCSLLPHLTAWDAIGDLSPDSNDPRLVLTGKWADLLPTIPEGRNYLWHTARGGGEPIFGWRTRYWNFLLKLAKDQPSWTIQAQPGPATGPFHWRNRKLSAAELGRLQTFPDGLIYEYKWGDTQRLIGNAVPSGLAEILAREIRVQLLGGRRRSVDLVLVPKRRADMPPPEQPLPVPRKYHSLIGHHAEHPGTGKGVGAIRRLQDVA
jgi:DNA (cytosine-5)-methyltransferase 1